MEVEEEKGGRRNRGGLNSQNGEESFGGGGGGGREEGGKKIKLRRGKGKKKKPGSRRREERGRGTVKKGFQTLAMRDSHPEYTHIYNIHIRSACLCPSYPLPRIFSRHTRLAVASLMIATTSIISGGRIWR